MMSMKNIFTNFKFNIDSILKTWFVITIIITITAFSWTINYINEKILIHDGFSKITIYLHYILILSLILILIPISFSFSFSFIFYLHYLFPFYCDLVLFPSLIHILMFNYIFILILIFILLSFHYYVIITSMFIPC